MLNEVRCIEVELFSYCNRKCKWCPNKDIDRNKYIEMSKETYMKLIQDLRRVGYKGVITYSRYNEPMSNINLLKERVRQTKEIIPNVKLVTNTNGDYLSRDNLNGLLIDELTIMDYDNKGMNACREKLLRCGVNIIKEFYPFIYGEYENMKILYYVDWSKHALLEDRGGYLDENIRLRWKNGKKLRDRPCYEPIHFIAIDYNGNVMPCCHMRSDIKFHREYILGNINNESIIDIYNNNKAVNIRKNISSGVLYKPCKYCQKDGGRYTRDNPSIFY